MSEVYIFGLKSCVENDIGMALGSLRFAIERARMLGAGTSLIPHIQLMQDVVDVAGEQHMALKQAIEASEEFRRQYDQSYLHVGDRPGGGSSIQMQPLKPQGPMKPLKPQGPVGPAHTLLHPEYAQSLSLHKK